jgi:hypothetical protein
VINQSGESDPSPQETNPVVVELAPSTTVTLSQGTSPHGSVKLTWVDPQDNSSIRTNSDEQSYEVYWDQGVDAPWQLLGTTTQKEFSQFVDSLSSSTYKFVVRKFNLCGSGDFSDSITFDISTQPE